MLEKQVSFWCNELMTGCGVVARQCHVSAAVQSVVVVGASILQPILGPFRPLNRHPTGRHFNADGKFNAKCVVDYWTCAQTFLLKRDR
jgi:hypothetical protein